MKGNQPHELSEAKNIQVCERNNCFIEITIYTNFVYIIYKKCFLHLFRNTYLNWYSNVVYYGIK